MSPFEVDLLWAIHEGPVRAYNLLHDPQVGGSLDAESVLELCRQAGYSEEASQRAAAQRAESRMSRDQPP